MPDGKVDILFQIRSDVAQLKAAQQEAGKLSNLLKTGFGVSGGLLAANAIGGVKNAITSAIGEGIRFNALVEQQTVAFQTLLGSADSASTRISELVKFAAFTPFELPEIIQANRVLEVLSDGMLSTERGMRLVGDAASSVGRGFRETAFWIGRLAAGLESGTAVGEATLRLIELGLVSGKAAKDLQFLAKEAHTTEEVWDILTDTFGKSAGAMELQSRTFNGLLATFKDVYRVTLGEATTALFEDLKETMEAYLIFMDALPSHAERAANGVKEQFSNIREAIKNSSLESNDAAIRAFDQAKSKGEARVIELTAQLAALETQAQALLPNGTNQSNFATVDQEALREIGDKQVKIQAEIKQINLEIAQTELLRWSRAQQSDWERQMNQEERNQLYSEEQKLIQDNIKLYDEAVAAERLITSQLERKQKLYERESQTNPERLKFLEDEVIRIDNAKKAAEERSAKFRDDAKREVYLRVRIKELEAEEYDILREKMKLERTIAEEREKAAEKLADEAKKAAKTAVELQDAGSMLALEYVRHQQTLLSNQKETASTRKEMAKLIGEEKILLNTLVTIWSQYASTVKDPSVRAAIESRIQSLKFEEEMLGQQEQDPTLLQESIDSFNELNDPAQHFQDGIGAAAAALMDYQTQVGTVSDQIYDSLMDIQGAMTGGIANSIEGLIKGTMDWSDAMENIGDTILNQVVKSFAQMLAQYITTRITMFILGKAFDGKAVSASASQATALAAAWAPAAIAASIATMGKAAIIGTGAYSVGQVAGTALTTGLSGLSNAAGASAGFAEGGYTGTGSKYDIKGPVHAGEFVMPRDVVSEAGPGLFYDMVDNVRTGTSGGGAPNVAIFDNRDDMNRWAESHDSEVWFRDMLDIHKGELV